MSRNIVPSRLIARIRSEAVDTAGPFLRTARHGRRCHSSCGANQVRKARTTYTNYIHSSCSGTSSSRASKPFYRGRLSLEAILLPPTAASAALEQPRAEQATLTDAEGSSDGSSPVPAVVEQRLQIGYVLPNGEAVASPPITTLPVTSTADTSGSAASTDRQSLTWSATHLLPVTETMVRDMASRNAALSMTFTTANRTTTTKTVESAPAAPTASAGKPAKPAKGSPMPEEAPWQADQQHVAAMDLAQLLVGDTDIVCTWPQKGLQMPVQLQAYNSIQIRVQV